MAFPRTGLTVQSAERNGRRTDSLPTKLLVCDGLMRPCEPPLGTVLASVQATLLSRSRLQHGGWLLVCQLGQHGGCAAEPQQWPRRQCYQVGDSAAGPCDGSSGIHILYTRPIRRKNFRRTARSSGIRSNCTISHR